MSDGKMLITVAPSGGGKTTFIKKLKSDFPDLIESVSCTTRHKRPHDLDGDDYYFLSVEQFKKKIENSEFLEWAQVHSNYYGTSKSFVDSEIAKGHDLLFDLDVQGADALKDHYGPKAHVIFIAPPSIEELEKRLRNRKTEKEEIIRERLDTARAEMERKNDYDYYLVNDDLQRAYDEFKEIVMKILEG